MLAKAAYPTSWPDKPASCFFPANQQMKKLVLSLAIAACSAPALADAPSFRSFATGLNKSLSCKYSKITPADENDGALYGCIAGKAETAKVFVNEERKSGRVLNVKLMWNDWHKDLGYGIHADKAEATLFLKALSQQLSPELSAQLLETFNQNSPRSFSSASWKVTYTYNRGPGIDERLFVFTPK